MKRLKLTSILMLFVAFATLHSQYIMPSGGIDGNGWQLGSTQYISWSTYFMDTTKTVDIYLWNGNSASFSTIAENIPVSNNYYLWSIPSNHPTGDKFKIKVVYHNNYRPEIKFISDDFFSISSTSPSAISSLSPRQIYVRNKDCIIDVYPNPAPEILTVSSTGKFFRVELVNVAGEVVFIRSFEYTTIYEVNMRQANIASGSYVLRVSFLGKTITQNIVVI